MLESYLFYSLGEVLVTYPVSLPLPIDVLEELEDMHNLDSTLGLDILENVHEHVELYVGMRKFQEKVHLACTPHVDD